LTAAPATLCRAGPEPGTAGRAGG